MTALLRLCGWLALTLVAGCAAQPDIARPAPAATPEASSQGGWPHGAMVSAANPYAVEAAAVILEAGGHAVDAAIAAHAVLGLVEPQSSGLGGGAFMLVYERATGAVTVYDGRETAPAGVTAELFIEDGEVLGFVPAWQSGLSVGVPGAVALYEAAHKAHGARPWPELFAAATELAQTGFVVSPRLNYLLRRVMRVSELDDNPATAAYFYPGGEPLAVGVVRDNPDYAQTLRQIAAEGAGAFYSGRLAKQIAAAARAKPRGGTLDEADLTGYRVRVSEPLCGAFRDYRICSAPPPSSGITQITIPALYDRLVAGASGFGDAALNAFVDAQRLAYADRDHYIADPAFAEVPVSGLYAPAYLDHRALQKFAPDATSTHGDPSEVLGGASYASRHGADKSQDFFGTTHLSVIDSQGNAVALTASIEAPFGSSRWVGGFLLNNEMTDFARDPRSDGKLAANAPAPGKRPRSSMSPTMVFDAAGDLYMVTGSPGGNSIVAYVAKTLLGVLAWDLSVQQAIDFPNIVARGDTVRVETAGAEGERIAALLREAGYEVQQSSGENSGLHLIVVHEEGLEGGADPRREGSVWQGHAVGAASRLD